MVKDKFINIINNYSNNLECFVSDKIKRCNIFENLQEISDSRSLTFFALGRANVKKGDFIPIIIIHEDEIASTLTAMTEAKYQQQKMILIVLGNDIQYEKLVVFSDSTEKIYEIEDELTLKEEIDNYIKRKTFKPILISIKMKINFSCNTQEEILRLLLEKINANELIYTNIENEINDNKIIKWKNEYGVISRYLGNLITTETNNYLLTTYESVIKDINPLYTRYIDEKVKIFYINCSNKKNNLANILEHNKIDFLQINNIRDLEKITLNNLKKPTIIEIIIKGE